MDGLGAGLGSLAFFGCIAFCVWVDYRKKKDDRDAAHQQRMKALELGYAALDAEIERARAYASAAWAAAVIGLVVPIVVILLTVIGTIVAVVKEAPNMSVPCVIAWSITGIIVLVAVLASLRTIRQLPRPAADAPARGVPGGKRGEPGSAEFQEKRLEL